VELEQIGERLTSFIAEQGGFTSVKIEELKPMAGGASRQILSFDAILEKDGKTTRRGMVLRRDLAGHKIETKRHDEFMVLRAAHQEGVLAPEVFWLCEDPAVLGSDFFIMSRIEGESLARRLLRDDTYAHARKVIPQQLAEILARIHKIDVKKHRLDFLRAPAGSPARAELAEYEEIYRRLALEEHPAFELAIRWLLAHIPQCSRQTLVHGDYRIGNIMFGPEGVRAILDWELPHLGDPMEDVGWVCVRAWRFGADDKPVGGLAQREEFWDAYEKASGWEVDRQSARFWEVFGNLRWGIFTISQSRSAIDGGVPSIELASIGRRTAETELELLNLID
jgi:aminoglycoside phosphotransferase (APT) family kinase protein